MRKALLRSAELVLGLFLSRAIVEAHGGKIWFDSKTNEGSTL